MIPADGVHIGAAIRILNYLDIHYIIISLKIIAEQRVYVTLLKMLFSVPNKIYVFIIEVLDIE